MRPEPVDSDLGAVATPTLLLLTQLLQEVGQLAEEAADRILGLSGIEVSLLSSLRSLQWKRINSMNTSDSVFSSSLNIFLQ